MNSLEKIRDFFEAAYTQNYLIKNDYKLIFVYEFHFNTKMNVFKTWSKRGFPASISIHPNSWNMSFVVAVSQ